MSLPVRAAAILAGLAVLAGSCTGGGGGDGSTGSPTATLVPPSPETVSPAPTGPGSAAAALEGLCTIPRPKVARGSDVPAEGPTPPVIAAVMDQIERLRGFGFSERVVAEPVTQQELAEGYLEYFETTYPEGFYERRSLAWQTIGVVPDGTSIRDELEEYATTQVIGYYDTLTGKLVFIGSRAPSPLERVTLAHELTHAIDDQRFGLEKIDALAARCRDEELAARLALVEGNATFFMLRWARTFLTVEEQLEVTREAAGQEPTPPDVPPFIRALQEWSYTQGLGFVTSLESRGGLGAIDGAFREPPVSTEQIIHPERYPNDVPTPLDVPDLADELGRGWADLDVQGVGEQWLLLMLRLRLDGASSAEASAGWDGGIYRAWTDGEDVAVVLRTAWDSGPDAEQFAGATQRWIDAAGTAGAVPAPQGTGVCVLFASDAATLEALESAAARTRTCPGRLP